jgi:hypothetical protein
MGAVTYPNAEVTEFLNERFVPVKLNAKERHPDFKEGLGRGKFLWAPLFVFLDGHGSELRRNLGFHAPGDFLAELRIVLGLAAMTRNRPDEALPWFDSAAETYPAADAAPEALFWAAAAAYRIDGLPAVIRRWDDLRARYPESTWAKRADVVPPEVRARVEAEAQHTR